MPEANDKHVEKSQDATKNPGMFVVKSAEGHGMRTSAIESAKQLASSGLARAKVTSLRTAKF